MKKQKVNIDFHSYRQGDLAPMATSIVATMTLNKTVFATPAPTLASITALVTTYSNILGKEEYAGKTGDLHAARKALETGLRQLGNYVNNLANGDLAILEKSGFPISKEPTPHGPIPEPTETGVELLADGGFHIWATPPDATYGGVLVAFAPVTSVEKDPYDWKIRYSSVPNIELRSGLVRGVEYKFAIAFVGTSDIVNWGIIGKTLFKN